MCTPGKWVKMGFKHDAPGDSSDSSGSESTWPRVGVYVFRPKVPINGTAQRVPRSTSPTGAATVASATTASAPPGAAPRAICRGQTGKSIHLPGHDPNGPGCDFGGHRRARTTIPRSSCSATPGRSASACLLNGPSTHWPKPPRGKIPRDALQARGSPSAEVLGPAGRSGTDAHAQPAWFARHFMRERRAPVAGVRGTEGLVLGLRRCYASSSDDLVVLS